tara:strand:+ start:446 stop:1318 length:873 start_codon:yes stop_codon:yes gene_type:complete
MKVLVKNKDKINYSLYSNGNLNFNEIESILLNNIKKNITLNQKNFNKNKEFDYIFNCVKSYCSKTKNIKNKYIKFIPPLIIDNNHFIYDVNFIPKLEDKIYFYQDLWAAKQVYKLNPKKIIDIGSSLNYLAHILSFREITMVDINPHDIYKLEGLNFIKSDATYLNEFEDSSLDCISALHSAEHFGLGRYGDKIDPLGHYKFISSMQRVVKKDGYIVFSVPTGRQSYTAFNAQRVFNPSLILDMFDKCNLLEFSVSAGKFYRNVPHSIFDLNKGSSGSAAGLFLFQKKVI